jgi:SAM-dependent methyltransferase
MSVIWHDLECGNYGEDLALWHELARSHGDPVLDVGAGTGRVTLALAASGHHLTALDRDPELLAELRRRAEGLPVTTALADARSFALEQRFPLCIVPMQTIQLLGGAEGRSAFLRRALDHLRTGGVVAIAITDALEPFELRADRPGPLPDVCERDGVVYSSQPTAVREEPDGFVLERRREVVAASGSRTVTEDRIRLDRLSVGQLETEAQATGLTPAGRAQVPANDEYVGSEVVILRA